jgi:hypothetical protein
MGTTALHVAVFDPLADWEIGYATAHIRRDQCQREPGRYSITTVGPTREPSAPTPATPPDTSRIADPPAATGSSPSPR